MLCAPFDDIDNNFEFKTHCFGERGGEGDGVIILEEVVNMLGEEDMVNMLEEVANMFGEDDALNMFPDFPGSVMLKSSLSYNL